MQEKLLKAYKKRLSKLFADTKTHLDSKQVGAEEAIISNTIPFMILATWREDGHKNDIPLLDETVKNVILATTCIFFGWEKTVNLHLRVALENILYGISLSKKPVALSGFFKNKTLAYRRFSSLVGEFIRSNSKAKKVESEFNISGEILNLYDYLSRWTHSLGTEYFADLQILGRNKLSPASIGRIKKGFRGLSRQASIVYSTTFPDFLSSLHRSQQKQFLSNLTIPERKKLREILDL